jgi:hypothetical protein
MVCHELGIARQVELAGQQALLVRAHADHSDPMAHAVAPS